MAMSGLNSQIIVSGVRKIHYALPDGKEMVEEYNMETDVLLRRIWKVSQAMRGEKWVVEIGDPIPQLDNLDSIGIKENATAVSFIHQLLFYEHAQHAP